MIKPLTQRHCCGAVGKPCPTNALLPENDWRRKRCRDCAAIERRSMKQASFRKNWPSYRTQRKLYRWEITHPRRHALLELAREVGLARAA